MLRTLTIRDVVLIGRLELSFVSGLGVLTGETGAGKSILLDALGLALGMRADARLVRHGTPQASVTAEFEVVEDHIVKRILAEQGIEAGGEALLLRRVLSADGRSRAFVNDQPVSVTLLRRLGCSLVEMHGQFESQRLLDQSTHRQLLDAYGGTAPLLAAVLAAWRTWSAATEARIRAAGELERLGRDEEYLRHAVAEIGELDPQPGDEEELAARRTLMMHSEKLIEAINQAAGELGAGRGVGDSLSAAIRHLERVAEMAGGRLDGVVAALGRAVLEAEEASALLAKASAEMDLDPQSLEAVEERLFALRGLARKHRVTVDALAALGGELAGQLAAFEDGGANLARLEGDEAAARSAYIEAAKELSKARRVAAEKLDKVVAGELAPLKLGKARFVTALEPLGEDGWGELGMDGAAFQVATNPGAPPGPLNKISSGGELARFTLALKVALAEADPVPTVVFDEVDSGVGGAVAAAVGERLARLAGSFQVLVITHSPQVAARGLHHWRVSKSEAASGALTAVDVLTEEARNEEIARMLAGAKVTDEARAAAGSLLQGGRQ